MRDSPAGRRRWQRPAPKADESVAAERRRRSMRVAAGQDVPKGPAEDAQVEHQRPVVDVVEVIFYTAGEVAVAAQVVDLGPAGDAGLDQVFLHVARDLAPELLDEFRTLGTGSDQRHVALQDVE